MVKFTCEDTSFDIQVLGRQRHNFLPVFICLNWKVCHPFLNVMLSRLLANAIIAVVFLRERVRYQDIFGKF